MVRSERCSTSLNPDRLVNGGAAHYAIYAGGRPGPHANKIQYMPMLKSEFDKQKAAAPNADASNFFPKIPARAG